MDLSIIIPTFNRLWSLPKAVNSCFDPSLEIEVIVVDDGSTDGTWQWLEQQKGIISIRQDNSGKDWAVNKGFDIATGKYIRFLDSDDWILPGSSANLFKRAEEDELDIVCAGHQVFDEKERFIKEINWTVCDDFLAQQLGECDSSHYSAYLFKKEFIKDIPHRQEYGAYDDRKFIIEVAIKQPKIGYMELPALAHRAHNNNRLQNTTGMQNAVNHWAFYKIFYSAFATLESKKMLTQRYKSAACNNLWHLAHWLAYTSIADANTVYKWVFELDPNYKPADNKALATLYRKLGFTATEKLLAFKRNLGI